MLLDVAAFDNFTMTLFEKRVTITGIVNGVNFTSFFYLGMMPGFAIADLICHVHKRRIDLDFAAVRLNLSGYLFNLRGKFYDVLLESEVNRKIRPIRMIRRLFG